MTGKTPGLARIFTDLIHFPTLQLVEQDPTAACLYTLHPPRPHPSATPYLILVELFRAARDGEDILGPLTPGVLPHPDEYNALTDTHRIHADGRGLRRRRSLRKLRSTCRALGTVWS